MQQRDITRIGYPSTATVTLPCTAAGLPPAQRNRDRTLRTAQMVRLLTRPWVDRYTSVPYWSTLEAICARVSGWV